MVPVPLTQADVAQLGTLAAALTGRSISSVHYQSSLAPESYDINNKRLVDEADRGVMIALDNNIRLVMTWAMQGLLEGVAVHLDPAVTPQDDIVDVSETFGWRQGIGRVIQHVSTLWHTPNEGCPRTLYGIGLDLGEQIGVTIGLGRLQDGGFHYQPDELVVIFDAALAEEYIRAYRMAEAERISM